MAQDLGLIATHDWQAYLARQEELQRLEALLRATAFDGRDVPADVSFDAAAKGTKWDVLLRRPDMTIDKLTLIWPEVLSFSKTARRRAEIEIKYEGYINRERRAAQSAGALEDVRIPRDFDYKGISGLSREVVEKLSRHLPETLGQASRLSGITPASLQIIHIYLRRARSSSEDSHE
jgi:tRNA uridine 5-carboxymethylaminomethyl modification enzyme